MNGIRLSGHRIGDPVKLGAVSFIASTFFVSSAFAAELPNRAAPPQKDPNTQQAQTCYVDGEKGILVPATGTCIRLYGSVSAQVTAGSHARAMLGDGP